MDPICLSGPEDIKIPRDSCSEAGGDATPAVRLRSTSCPCTPFPLSRQQEETLCSENQFFPLKKFFLNCTKRLELFILVHVAAYDSAISQPVTTGLCRVTGLLFCSFLIFFSLLVIFFLIGLLNSFLGLKFLVVKKINLPLKRLILRITEMRFS